MGITVKDINAIQVNQGQLAVQWIGQAGFLLKTDTGLVIAVDPYLTNSVENSLGSDFKRLMLPLFTPEEFASDILLITHHHGDHFDTEAVPVIMKNSRTQMVCCPVTYKLAAEIGIESSRMQPMKEGDKCCIEGINIQGIYADHGELAPEAIGFLLTVSDITIYIIGDSAYVPEKITESLGIINPDIMITPINGAFGNLNGAEAAQLAKDVKAKTVIPCHFWTFAIHKGDPQDFVDAMQKIIPEADARLLCQGEIFIFNKDQNKE